MARVIWPLVLAVLLVGRSAAVDKLSIDYDRNLNYLPCRVEVQQQQRYPLRRGTLPLLVQSVSTRSAGGAQYAAAFVANSQAEDGTPAHVRFLSADTWRSGEDHILDLRLSDFGIYFDNAAQVPAVAAVGYRHDSAFVCRVRAGSTENSYCFIRAGCNRNLAPWPGLRECVLLGDIDRDGSTEAIFLVGSSRDVSSRHLCCVDLATMTLEWITPFPLYIVRAFADPDEKSDHTVLLLQAYGAAPGTKSPSHGDLYGHVIRVNERGILLDDRIVSKTGDIFAAACKDNVFYFSHMFPCATTTAEADTAHSSHLLSALSGNEVLFTIPIPDALVDMWLMDYGRDGTTDLVTLSTSGVVQIYNAQHQLIAESDSIPTLGSFCGFLPPVDGSDSTLAFVSSEGIALYTTDFRKLAVVPTKVQYAQVLSTAEGRLTTMLATDAGEYVVARLYRRPVLDQLAILYFDYRHYFIAVISCLSAGLLMLAYYSRRLRTQKREIQTAHSELMATHHALKKAQAQLVEQERFAMAQSIAGSFAHEIRNALFPADVSIAKIHEIVDVERFDRQRLVRLVDLAERAVTRAVALTNLISQYTKLESQYLPEATRFATVLQEVLSTNIGRIEDQCVSVTVTGPGDCDIAMHPQHLYIVLNNLLINALDALASSPKAAISVQWQVRGKRLIVHFGDNGTGIPPDDRDRIFEAFFSTKPNTGSGLGLAIIKRLVEMYGGTIALSDQHEAGTRFELSLKLWDATGTISEPRNMESV